MRKRVGSLLAALCAASLASGQEPPARPKIGVALGGGGARGMAHIGVLRALDELNIPIDYVAGTSMGSVVGGLYACGYTTEGIESLVKRIKWTTLFEDAPDRPERSFRQKEDDFDHLLPLEFGLDFKRGGLVLPPGLIAGSKLGYVLETATLPCSGVANFGDLRLPFRAVATDIQTGEAVVLEKGSLARAIRASMAIPAIFTPIELDGMLLVDGGESQNLPVQTVRAMGADIVIAVDVGESGVAPKKKPDNLGAMIGRLIDLPLQQNTQVSRKLADLVIQPNLAGYTSADFVRGTEMIPLGYQAAMAQAEALRKWSAPAAAYAEWDRRHDAPLPAAPVIDAVEVAPVPGVDSRRLTRLILSKPGPLDVIVLGQDMKRIYALGLFEIVSYAIVEEDGKRILRITATPKPWGPTYLRIGLNLATDLEAFTRFGLIALINATELNTLGGQWKTTFQLGSPLYIQTAFYQPVEYSGHFFVSPRAAWGKRLRNVYDEEGHAIGTFEVERGGLGFDLGWDIGTVAELRAGMQWGYGKGRPRVGDPAFPEVSVDEGAFVASVVVDQLDSVNVPRHGYYGVAELRAERTGLGASDSYDHLRWGAIGVQTIGRWTGLARIQGGTGLGSQVPFYDEFELGGLVNLSGRPPGQLTGQTSALGALLLYRRMNRESGAIIKNLYLGVSAEAGNAWKAGEPVTIGTMKTAGSVFAIADTIIGPFTFAYGRSGSQNSAFYLFLNRSF